MFCVCLWSNLNMWEIPPKFLPMAKMVSITAINEINIHKYISPNIYFLFLPFSQVHQALAISSIIFGPKQYSNSMNRGYRIVIHKDVAKVPWLLSLCKVVLYGHNYDWSVHANYPSHKLRVLLTISIIPQKLFYNFATGYGGHQKPKSSQLEAQSICGFASNSFYVHQNSGSRSTRFHVGCLFCSLSHIPHVDSLLEQFTRISSWRNTFVKYLASVLYQYWVLQDFVSKSIDTKCGINIIQIKRVHTLEKI